MDSETNGLLDTIREHARIIRRLLESPAPDDIETNARIWRALYVDSRSNVVAASIHKAGAGPLYVQVEREYGSHQQGSHHAIQGQVLTPEEIAVFLDLSEVDPEDVEWHEHITPMPQFADGKRIVVARQEIPRNLH